MLATAFYITAGIALTLFFLSLVNYDTKQLNFLIPALGAGLNLIACLGAMQIEVPYTYIYNVNTTVYTYTTTVLHQSLPLALMFMLFGIFCCVKVFWNLVLLARQLRIEKELKMEGWM